MSRPCKTPEEWVTRVSGKNFKPDDLPETVIEHAECFRQNR
jgi:hypothetical protein